MKQLFSVRNWETFQHYKDRNPPWIKLHNHLLDDYDFECLPDATKCHLLCIWMLASRTNNEMVYDNSWVKRKIGANSSVDLELLLSVGFIELHSKGQDASTVLVSEEERRGEAEAKENAINDRFDDFWSMYDKKDGLAKCKSKWRKLKESEKDAVFKALPSYILSTPDKQYRKNPLTWLNGEHWNDDIENIKQIATFRPKEFSQ